jgi:hypothetical protein
MDPIFQNISSILWSATTSASYTGNAWYVSFGDGSADNYFKSDSNQVRCVRGRQFDFLTSYYGRWVYVDSAEVVDIDTNAIIPDLKLINTNHIQSGNRHLIRAGIPNVKLSGALITKAEAKSTASKSLKGLSGIGSMKMILKNAKEEEETFVLTPTSDTSKIGKSVIVKSDGSEEEMSSEKIEAKTKTLIEAKEKIKEIIVYVKPPEENRPIDIPKSAPITAPTGDVRITVEDGQANKASFNVTVIGEDTDMGVLTVTDSEVLAYNFKSTIAHENDYLYFGYNDSEREISYSKKVTICNIGSEDISGTSFVIGVDSNYSHLVRTFSTSYDDSLIGFGAGVCKQYNINFDFKRPSELTKVKINITIKDNFNNITWDDYVAIKLSPYPHLNLYLVSNKVSLNGFLVAPGRQLIKVTFSGSNSNSFVRVPLKTDDTYEVVLSTPNINSEDTYQIGSDKKPDASKMLGFTDVGIHEPDNDLDHATIIPLLGGESIGYLHKNDIDFYKLVDLPEVFDQNSTYNPNDKIEIQFSTDMNSSTVTSESVTLVDSLSSPIPTSFEYNSTSRVVTLTPLSTLAIGEYKVLLASSLETASGNTLAKEKKIEILLHLERKNGVVIDTKTNLEWQDSYEDNITKHAVWSDAMSYCEALSLDGKSDWRLPEIEELKSIIDTSETPMHYSIFESITSSNVWSATTDASNTDFAWGVYFDSGSAYPNLKSLSTQVRCVRGRQ